MVNIRVDSSSGHFSIDTKSVLSVEDGWVIRRCLFYFLKLQTFFKTVALFFTSTSTHWEFHCSVHLSELNALSLSHCSRARGCAVLPQPSAELILSSFPGAYFPSVYSLWWSVWFKSFASLLTRLFASLSLTLKILYIFFCR